MNDQQKSLLALGQALRAAGYGFTAPTPLTCRRVLSRPPASGADPLIEIFGWNRPFEADALSGSYRAMMEKAGVCEKVPGGQWRSLVRFSTLNGLLFVHSGFPTDALDAVFFGPDTYRFCRAIRWFAERETGFSPRTVIDIGAGTGAGGIFAGECFPAAGNIILADINDRALQLAEVNAGLNATAGVQCVHSDVLAGVSEPGDFIVSNPPYLVDAGRRAYRHGGGDWGCDLALRIVEQALSRLSDDGRLLLYTGSPIVRGADMFLQAVTPLLRERAKAYRYEETDPDVFGEELEHAPYDQADRIATVLLYVKASDIYSVT
jgi:methylase of polypeptide subunit release factors